MCGIIGYAGHRPAVPVVVEGLRRLEYRGYDSAGVAFARQGDLHVVRATGKLASLEEKLAHQKRQRELESKRSKLRRELFLRQDEVEAQRNDLISQLEVQLQQQVEERTLFTIEWELA